MSNSDQVASGRERAQREKQQHDKGGNRETSRLERIWIDSFRAEVQNREVRGEHRRASQDEGRCYGSRQPRRMGLVALAVVAAAVLLRRLLEALLGAVAVETLKRQRNRCDERRQDRGTDRIGSVAETHRKANRSARERRKRDRVDER